MASGRYFFDVDFTRCRISYNMKAPVTNTHMKAFVASFGQPLLYDQGSYEDRDRMPFFNLDQLVDYINSSGLSYAANVGVTDMHPFFSRLTEFLIGNKYIDHTNVHASYAVDMDKIWKCITERHADLVEFEVGGMVVQAKITNVAKHIPTVEEEFKDAVRAEIEDIKATAEAELERERAEIAERAGYAVPLDDLFAGWASCVGGLVYRVSHAPNVIVSNLVSYRVDPKIVKKFRHDILIRYVVKTGYIHVTNVNGSVENPRPTNHTHMDSVQCTGTIKTAPNLPYDKAKKLILDVVNSLNVVNRDSMLGDTYGTFYINGEFLKNQCTPVEGTIKDGDVL